MCVDASHYQGVAFGHPPGLQTHLRQLVGQLHTVHPTAGSHVALAADVDVHLTDLRETQITSSA